MILRLDDSGLTPIRQIRHEASSRTMAIRRVIAWPALAWGTTIKIMT